MFFLRKKLLRLRPVYTGPRDSESGCGSRENPMRTVSGSRVTSISGQFGYVPPKSPPPPPFCPIWLPSSFWTKELRKQGTHTAVKSQQTHKVSPWHMVRFRASSTHMLLFFFNSYILSTFLYDKNSAWALSFILNRVYDFMKFLTPLKYKPWSRFY